MSENNANRVLVIFAHPALYKSKINTELIKVVRGKEDVTFHDLYEAYPDFLIDVEKEQRLLLEHDVIVFQHPFYWYSSPAIIKEWEDLVLEFGFAYGQGGTALKGKKMMTAISAGGSHDSYGAGGIHNHKLIEFLKPFEQSAVLCGMEYLPPFVVHDASTMKNSGDIAVYKDLYGRIINALRDGDIDSSELSGYEYMNDYFKEKSKSGSV